MLHNAFSPIFQGSFTTQDGRTVLSGEFGFSPWTKVLFSIWFGGLIVFAILCVLGTPFLAIQVGPSFLWEGLLIALALAGGSLFMAYIGYAFMRLLWSMSRGDIEDITRHVYKVLTRA
jgi:hypothetical protein